MSCSGIERLIDAYAEEQVTPSQQAEVDEHVAYCARCARTLRESRQLRLLLAQSPARHVSARFEQNLARALESAPAAPRPAGWWERFQVRFEWRLRVPALAAAGSLAVALVVVVSVPVAQQAQERDLRRQELFASTVLRHQQLQDANSDAAWEAAEESIQLATGAAVVE